MTEENVFNVAIGIQETPFTAYGNSNDLHVAVRAATDLLKAQIYTKTAEYKCTVEDANVQIQDLNQMLSEIDKAAESVSEQP